MIRRLFFAMSDIWLSADIFRFDCVCSMAFGKRYFPYNNKKRENSRLLDRVRAFSDLCFARTLKDIHLCLILKPVGSGSLRRTIPLGTYHYKGSRWTSLKKIRPKGLFIPKIRLFKESVLGEK